MNDELSLYHYGKKGMKWGVRNENYTNNQRRRDRQVYGLGGERRINRTMNKYGDSVSTARGFEKKRRDRVMNKNKYVRQGGKIGGTIAGGIGGLVAARLVKHGLGTSAANKVLGGANALLIREILSDPILNTAIVAGGAKVGNMFAGDMAVALNMRLHGYDPSRA